MFPRFYRLTNQEMTDLFSNDIFGENAQLQKVFPEARLFKNAEGHIAGMESHDGCEKLHFDEPVAGNLELTASKVLTSMQNVVRWNISIKTAERSAEKYENICDWVRNSNLVQATVVADSIYFST